MINYSDLSCLVDDLNNLHGVKECKINSFFIGSVSSHKNGYNLKQITSLRPHKSIDVTKQASIAKCYIEVKNLIKTFKD